MYAVDASYKISRILRNAELTATQKTLAIKECKKAAKKNVRKQRIETLCAMMAFAFSVLKVVAANIAGVLPTYYPH